GLTLSIRSGEYTVSLTHLGSLALRAGAGVDEGATVGTIGPSGTLEFDVPYVYLGIRLTDDENGYVDPLSLLPQRAVSPPPSPPPPPAPVTNAATSVPPPIAAESPAAAQGPSPSTEPDSAPPAAAA